MPSVATLLISSALITPGFAYLMRRYVLRPGVEPLAFILACIASYAFLLLSLPFREIEIESAMLAFDLDGSGGVGSAEMTPDAKLAVDRWQHDTGRNFAPFTGLFLVPIWCLVVYTLLAIVHLPLRFLLKVEDRG